jgi:hypothetical protein
VELLAFSLDWSLTSNIKRKAPCKDYRTGSVFTAILVLCLDTEEVKKVRVYPTMISKTLSTANIINHSPLGAAALAELPPLARPLDRLTTYGESHYRLYVDVLKGICDRLPPVFGLAVWKPDRIFRSL